ncbi:putative ribokinase [Saccharomycopsis crataegensis]|uniref:Ribokinase n=1 Tax=Saccharomycopsis crataegensis TaxID=43959 RepID=A0AAV5QWT3_9ASCO|nr:putative ribokinase [Saccharomycopsis crataegensis]
MTKTILTVIGSLNYDLVTFTSRVPQGGETIKADSFETHTGGKGFNEALALGRLLPSTVKNNDTYTVRMIGKVGDDSFGTELLDSLKKEAVDISEVTVENGVRTGVATILVESDGENRILIAGGANDLLTPSNSDFDKYFPAHDSQKQQFVMLQNEFPYFVQTINWIKTNRPNIQIAYNPSPMKKVPGDYLKNVDLLIVNEIESQQILESLDIPNDVPNSFTTSNDKVEYYENVARKLLPKINSSGVNLVIITLGSMGVLFITTRDGTPKVEFLKSRTVAKENVIDTTGAGDTFFGSVVSQLSLNREAYGDAIKFATVASALAIQKKGAGDSIPSYENVTQHLQ